MVIVSMENGLKLIEVSVTEIQCHDDGSFMFYQIRGGERPNSFVLNCYHYHDSQTPDLYVLNPPYSLDRSRKVLLLS